MYSVLIDALTAINLQPYWKPIKTNIQNISRESYSMQYNKGIQKDNQTMKLQSNKWTAF